MLKPQALAACALLAALTALIALPAPALATDVPLATSGGQAGYGEWQQFNVSEIDSLGFGVEWIDFSNSTTEGFGTPLTFTFTIGAGQIGSFTVVDGAFGGDTFRVTDFGSVIGTTSAVPATDYASAPDLGYDFGAALAHPAFSQGVISFGAGSYRISGLLDQSVMLDGLPLNATVGAVRLTVSAVPLPVPEPSSYAMLIAGLGLVGALARRRR